MKVYFCKYLPPRADFLKTMSEQERVWMGEHGAYLDELLAQGTVKAHGPVMESTGGFGLSLWEVDDDQDIAALTAQDPIVKNGVGHYEHFPMLQLKTRG